MSRFLLLLALLLQLAVGPTTLLGGLAHEAECGGCCPPVAQEVCGCSDAPAVPVKPAQVAAGQVDVKQMIAPVLICLGQSFVEAARAQYSDAPALMDTPAVPVRDLLCVRLV